MEETQLKKPNMVNDLTQGSILRKLVLFALPFMAANLLNTLYTLVDLSIIGKFLGSEALSAAKSPLCSMPSALVWAAEDRF